MPPYPSRIATRRGIDEMMAVDAMQTEPTFDALALAALLRRDGGRPLHSQLEVGLRSLIQSGQVPMGAILPGEHELAAGLSLSRHTIRHALGVLAAEGLLVR